MVMIRKVFGESTHTLRRHERKQLEYRFNCWSCQYFGCRFFFFLFFLVRRELWRGSDAQSFIGKTLWRTLHNEKMCYNESVKQVCLSPPILFSFSFLWGVLLVIKEVL